MIRPLRIGGLRTLIFVLLTSLLVACGTPTTPTPVVEQPTEQPAAENPDPQAAVDAPTVTPVADAPTTAATTAPVTAPAAPAVAPAATRPGTAPPSVQPIAPTVAVKVRPNSTSALATQRLITYYGHPYDDRMGILGEFDPLTMVQKLKAQTAAYTAADPTRPGLCTIELIASVAQGSPGKDGLYIARTPTAEIEKWAQLAEQQGCLLMLDIQMGYDSVENDVKAILPFLQRPYVHLAIDPEFHVARGQIPGESFGSVTSTEVMGAMQTLGNLVRQYNLPDKILVLHQFRQDMLPDKDNIKTMPNVDLVVMMDGWGLPEAKIANYNAFIRDDLLQYGGIKLFYRQDAPLLTPAEVIQLDPTPLVVIYQ